MKLQPGETLFLAAALSLDAAAVAVAGGAALGRFELRAAFRMGAFFGGFQFLMPLLGWGCGSGLRNFIGRFDHWAAFGLLMFAGGKMLFESFSGHRERVPDSLFGMRTLFLLALATSIDAFAVGLSLSLLGSGIMLPAAVIGAVAFGFTLAGVYAGCRCGGFLAGKAEALGGIILMGIGLKVLWEHLA